MTGFRAAETRPCPRCAIALPPEVALCRECRTLSSPSGSLGGADLRRWDLGGVDLRGVDLGGARMQGATLAGARLDGAHLARAVLAKADLTDAVLTDANLDGADLRRANMHRTIVAGASLDRAAIDMCYAGLLSGFRGIPTWVALDEVLPSREPRRFTTFDNEPIVCPKCAGETFVAVDTHRGNWLEPSWILAFLLPRKPGTDFQLVCDRCSASVWQGELPLLR
jgi:hypothetical protein